jgi:hypothetical protein
MKLRTVALCMSVGLAACGGHVEAGTATSGSGGSAGSGSAPGSGSSGGASSGGSGASGSSGVLCIPPATNGPGPGDVYVLKTFLTDPPSNPQWSYVATITSTTPPSPFLGMTASGMAQFTIESDQLDLVTTTSADSGAVVDQWSVQNVDLSPGSGCNASQGQDWQSTTWIDWQFAKSGNGDLELLDPIPPGPPGAMLPPPPPLYGCVAEGGNPQASLVPGTFVADTTANTLSWQMQVQENISCAATSLMQVTLSLSYVLRRL